MTPLFVFNTGAANKYFFSRTVMERHCFRVEPRVPQLYSHRPACHITKRHSVSASLIYPLTRPLIKPSLSILTGLAKGWNLEIQVPNKKKQPKTSEFLKRERLTRSWIPTNPFIFLKKIHPWWPRFEAFLGGSEKTTLPLEKWRRKHTISTPFLGIQKTLHDRNGCNQH